jgi:hypothetical protein
MSLPRSLPGAILLGFIAGFLGVVIFHQAMLGALYAFGLASAPPFNIQRVGPLGLAQVWSSAFWGGVWGIVLVWTAARVKVSPLVYGAVFGAVLPTLVAWFVAAPLKGQPLAAGYVPARMLIGPLVNGAWGFGTIVVCRGLMRVPILGRAR